jgi:predicted PurR-regulated permease PerM
MTVPNAPPRHAALGDAPLVDAHLADAALADAALVDAALVDAPGVDASAAGASPSFAARPPPPPPQAEEPVWQVEAAPSPRAHATRAQRIGAVVALLIAFWLALQLFASVLLPFVAAAGIAYGLDPPTTRLVRLGLPRTGAAMLMMLGLIAAALLFALLLYPLALAQVGLLFGRVPQYVSLLQGWANQQIVHLQASFGSDVVNDKLRDLVSSQAGSMLSFLASALSRVIGGGFAIFNVLTLLVVTPVVAFYLLRDWPRLVAMVDSWLPRRYAAVIRAQVREVDRILSAWVRGQALCCLLLAAYYIVALSLAGLDLGLIVGLAAGLLSFIPYVGSITGGVAAIGLALAQFHSWRAVFVIAGILVTGQILEGYVIYPRFLGDRVELSAVWVIFALFAGGAAFGFLGVMLAVPVAATIGVLCRFWLRRYLTSPLYLDPPNRPVA